MATPIMRWLQAVDGPIDAVQPDAGGAGPGGATEADVVVVLQALLDRHAMLRLRVDDDGAGGWSLDGARTRIGRCRRLPATGRRAVRRGRWWRRGRG